MVLSNLFKPFEPFTLKTSMRTADKDLLRATNLILNDNFVKFNDVIQRRVVPGVHRDVPAVFAHKTDAKIQLYNFLFWNACASFI